MSKFRVGTLLAYLGSVGITEDFPPRLLRGNSPMIIKDVLEEPFHIIRLDGKKRLPIKREAARSPNSVSGKT